MEKICKICLKEFDAKQSNYQTCGNEDCMYQWKMLTTKKYRQDRSDITNFLNRKSYERNKEARVKHLEEYRKANLKIKCSQQKVHNAIAKGKIKKGMECEICHSVENVVAHHQDYDKPLEVNWLCKKCHNAVHKAVITVMQLATA